MSSLAENPRPKATQKVGRPPLPLPETPIVNATAAQPAPLAPITNTPWEDAWRYYADFYQRSVLFLDILRERADNMLAHEQAGRT